MPLASIFEVPVVSQCPHTSTGRGVLKLSHGVIAIFAGAVFDKIEWMALMTGTRSEDGLDITVTGLRIPLQTRNAVNCEFVNLEPLDSDVVGVVHSHHHMTARFSNTDDTQLNPKFPVSIVLAQLRANDSDIEQLFGFSYQAEGRAALPCGTLGIIPFTAAPYPAIEAWPQLLQVGYVEPNLNTPLWHCPHNEAKLEGFMQRCTTKCGIESVAKGKAIFGRNGKEFIAGVEKATRAEYKFANNQGVNGGQVIHVNDKRYQKGKLKKHDYWGEERYIDGEMIKHWSDF